MVFMNMRGELLFRKITEIFAILFLGIIFSACSVGPVYVVFGHDMEKQEWMSETKQSNPIDADSKIKATLTE